MEIYCDGLCEPTNPGGHACYGFVALEEGKELAARYGYIGSGEGMTNNLAEYTAVIEALKWGYTQGHRGFTIKTDSQLVVKQVSGEWQIKAGHLRPLAERIRNGMRFCEATTLLWVPREQNTRADRLSRIAYAKAKRGS
jgi:ribonuclease HI